MKNQKYISEETNNEILENYFNRYKQSKNVRKSGINYFLEKFRAEKRLPIIQISKISKSQLIDYFDWLKGLNSISLTTKKNKWILLKSLLEYCMEYYDDFHIVIPSKTINWNNANQKKPSSNKNIIMSKEEVEIILSYIKNIHFNYYIIFRLFAETGIRKGGIINANMEGLNLEKRYLETIEKFGRNAIYYFSQDFVKYLKIYLDNRKLRSISIKALFLNNRDTRFGSRAFNLFLKNISKKLEINKNITCHTFRRTLNTLRKKMECPSEDRKILLNHKVSDVNYNSYVKLQYTDFINLHDKWYPYNKL